MDFFKNYNRLVGWTYAALLVGVIGLLYVEIQGKRGDELEVIRSRVARHMGAVELILRAATDYVDAMRINAWSFYAATPSEGFTPTLLFRQLKFDSKAGYFHLDDVAAPDSTGNLTGTGSIEGRGPEFYRDVEMALDLAGIFQTINLSLPSATESYFISKDEFQDVFPWEPSYKTRFSPDVYKKQVYVMGTPAQNPAREKYWTPAYIGDSDNGLMVSTGAPIYEDDVFRGVVGIDISLEYLNRVNADFGYDLGEVYLANNYDDLLAHPRLVSATEDRTIQTLASVLPKDLLAPGKKLSDYPDHEVITSRGYIIIQDGFRNAPWRLVYVLEERELYLRLLRERGPQVLVVIGALTLLLVVTNAITRREFVAPANQLVQHIDRESRFEPTVTPKVPAAWQPWFKTISNAFRVHSQFLSMQQELDVARRMQLSILPQSFPDRPDLALFGTMRSAKEVGGDFYDFFALDETRIGIIVADVSGKGVPAALFGMVSRTFLRATATSGKSIGETVASTNDSLCVDNDSSTFVTVFYGILDTATGELTYVNAGHPPPYQIRRDGTATPLAPTDGIALGIMDGMPFEHESITLEPGDTLVMFTDGVTEAMDPQENEFTETRVERSLTGTYGLSVRDFVSKLIRDVDQFAAEAPQADDITVVAVTYKGTPTAEQARPIAA